METNLQRFGVSIDNTLLEEFDELIAKKGYTNRSEAIRDLIRDYLIEERWRTGTAQAVGTITLVYNHHLRELSDRLNDIQHDYHDKIVSVLHVHLDAHHCLEVLVVRGDTTAIQTIAGRLSSVKGVQHCKLVTTAGGNI
ncbi:CopG family transcriptional regulator [Hydrogenispora ethanolica]|jgi:CopG family nickel-responsive transcriptional regulator|uniref:Putative nickel-responsive regulator n=1 Tax=Hydrogenispora ethanolica TaxID=1082276 RepID=A0A4R1S265_HYDET|nr:nickel-responsive transcriptional regulator NikR [Hydrogenispora ethanolica]TCL73251.1 CopG family transcriptional regulator [Hydrogenispora ethanolica]